YNYTPRLVIVDEPELHLHPGLATVFWREVERTYRDDFFIYFTHNLLFAAPQHNAFRIGLVLSCISRNELEKLPLPEENQRLLDALSTAGRDWPKNNSLIAGKFRGICTFEKLGQKSFDS